MVFEIGDVIACLIAEPADKLLVNKFYEIVEVNPKFTLYYYGDTTPIEVKNPFTSSGLNKFYNYKDFKIGDEVVCFILPQLRKLEYNKKYKVENVIKNQVCINTIWHWSCRFKPNEQKQTICPDCKGTGVYVGFIKTEPCKTCQTKLN